MSAKPAGNAKFFRMDEQLQALAIKIGHALALKPEYFVTQAPELDALQKLTPDQLNAFARDHGWGVVPMLNGSLIQFYRDATAIAANEIRDELEAEQS
jgi:hypothetical protein